MFLKIDKKKIKKKKMEIENNDEQENTLKRDRDDEEDTIEKDIENMSNVCQQDLASFLYQFQTKGTEENPIDEKDLEDFKKHSFDVGFGLDYINPNNQNNKKK